MARARPGSSTPERAGLYVRVSMDRSLKGQTDEIVSPATQEDRSRAYCAAQAWTAQQIERDIDESAYRQHYTKRAGLMRLLEAIERGELTKLIVWKFSRLSRRLREFSEICDRVEAAGGGVVSVSEQVDTSTPAGRLIRNILASFAEFQAAELSEQIYETWVTRAKQGLRPPGQAPYGTINKRGMLMPDPDTHHHLLAMYRTYAETGSLRACWDYLDQAKVSPSRAEGWHLISIRKILRNPIYTGRLDWDGTEYAGQWEPLVPIELWETVQGMLEGRRDTRERRRDSRLLSGLVLCGCCGQPMWMRHDQRKKERELMILYTCYARHSLRRGCTSTPTVVAEELEETVWAAVRAVAKGVDRQSLLSTISAPAGIDPEPLQRARTRLTGQIATLFDLVGADEISRSEFRVQHSRYKDELAEIDTQLNGLRPAPTQQVARALGQVETADTLEDRRNVLEALGVTVTITDRQAWLEIIGLDPMRLRPRKIANTMHFGSEYQRLDYQHAYMTDWQHKFLRRAWDRFDRQRIADRMGRSKNAIHRAVYRLRDKPSTMSPSR